MLLLDLAADAAGFDERQLEALSIRGLANDGRDLGQAGELRRAPAALPDDELIALSNPPDDDGLEDPGVVERCREI